MKKTILHAALLTLVMFSTAHAVVITIDDFTDAQGPVSDAVVGGGPATSTIATPPLTLPEISSRTLSIDLLARAGVFQSSVEVAGGELDVTNGGGEDSQVKVTWTLIPGVFSGLGAVTDLGFRLNVVQSDGNPTNLNLTVGANNLGSFSIAPNTVNQLLPFALSTAVADELNAGGALVLTINGVPGWDLSLSQFDLTFNEATTPIPEPGTVSLLGLGLLGIGWSTWRRKRNAQ